jgi:hypothetical protein
LADPAGARTALWMSLRKEGTLFGVFTIYRQEVRPFSEKEIAAGKLRRAGSDRPGECAAPR